MRLAFFGTGEFAVSALRALSDHVVLVVSQPSRPSGRGLKPIKSPIHRAALELGLEVATPERCRAPEFVESVRSLDLEALVVAAYGQILPVSLLEAAKQGAFNLHGSILPKYRGAAPIQRAIESGESLTGVTLMAMDRGMDAGDVIDVAQTPIGQDETYGELQSRLGEIAAGLIQRWAPRLALGDFPRVPQDHSSASFARKVSKEQAELHFGGAAKVEYNRFRAFTPHPGPYVRLSSGILRVHQARLAPSNDSTPGEILISGDGLRVAFKDGAIDLLEVQPEGRRRMGGRDFANGARLKPGMFLP